MSVERQRDTCACDSYMYVRTYMYIFKGNSPCSSHRRTEVYNPSMYRARSLSFFFVTLARGVPYVLLLLLLFLRVLLPLLLLLLLVLLVPLLLRHRSRHNTAAF